MHANLSESTDFGVMAVPVASLVLGGVVDALTSGTAAEKHAATRVRHG